MSITIGFGYDSMATINNADLRALAADFDYGIEFGFEHFEEDCRFGIIKAMEILSIQNVIVLRSPKERNANLAFEIYQDLSKSFLSNERPVFFSFLECLFGILKEKKYTKFCWFQADEWYEDTMTRVSLGGLDELLLILSRPGGASLLTLSNKKNTYPVNDDFPFLFISDSNISYSFLK
ncbi:hypothetical protein WJT86_12255 [Microvirga sp. W0021]|uniref:Uncharacterized protein n=1 Tax=Hohaiivirga grylli TaxID=3133970 RepID=A0ABV0BLJ7_9HYPH